MIGRAVWVALVLGVAIVTASVQLDRQSRYVPSLAGSVPDPARSFAQLHIAGEALQSGASEAALAETRTLVARRPMPAAHLRLLSIAQYNAGEIEQGGYSIQLAARRGWRDLAAQRAMFELALAAGDEREAARRYAALFIRPGETEADLRSLAGRVFAPGNLAARAEFAGIVAGAERWHPAYLRKAPVVLATEDLIDITRRATAAGARFDCGQAQIAIKRVTSTSPAAAPAFRAALGGC